MGSKGFWVALALVLWWFQGIEGFPAEAADEEGEGLGIDLVQTLEISSGETEKDLLGWITGIDLDKENNIFILDGQRCHLYLFSKGGRFIKKIGGKGEGPGEFRGPVDLQLTAEGEIFVLDQFKIHRFSPEGRFVEHFVLNRKPRRFFVDPGQAFYLVYYSQGGADMTRNMLVLSRFDREMNHVADLLEVTVSRIIRETVDGKTMSFQIENPYSPSLAFARSGHTGFIMADSTRYRLYLYDGRASLVGQLVKKAEEIPITAKEKEHIYNLYAPYYEKSWSKSRLREAIQYPEHRPFFKEILVDDQGRIYVRSLKSVLEGKGNPRYFFDVFNRNGDFICTINLGIIPELIDGGDFYAVHEDEASGEITVRRYQSQNWK